MAAPSPDDLAHAAIALMRSASSSGWRGPDAYDGLWHRWPSALVAGRRRRQVIMQVHARAPWDIRRMYRRGHPLIPKALGIYGSVGLRAHAITGDTEGLELAAEALDLLMSDETAGPEAWGYHWDMQTRWSFYPAGSPNVVVTAFAAAALAEAAGPLGRPDMLERARTAARWVDRELFLESDGHYVYHPGSRVNIHNANLLGALTVHNLAGAGEDGARRIERAVGCTLGAQRDDGSWGYGEGGKLEWADSFHTGYVLTCLSRLTSEDPAIPGAVARGVRFYEGFFDAAGRAQLWADRPFPEDAHSAGTGMTTLAELVPAGYADRALLARVAHRVVKEGIRDGHAVYRRYRRLTTTVSYMRWADAHVALGLVDAAGVLHEPVTTAKPRSTV